MPTIDPTRVLGRNPDRLTPTERIALAGKLIALEVYTPATIPLRRIEAIGDSLEDCLQMLRARRLNPKIFEFTRVSPPWNG